MQNLRQKLRISFYKSKFWIYSIRLKIWLSTIRRKWRYFIRKPKEIIIGILSSKIILIVLIFPTAYLANWFYKSVISKYPNLDNNIAAEVIGILITVLIIDFLYDTKRQYELKERLLIEIRSTDNGTASRAALLLESNGWLHDGTLENKDLMNANLSNFNPNKYPVFKRTNLTKANFSYSTFLSADFSYSASSPLLQGYAYLGPLFHDGEFYSCRFNDSKLSGADFSNAVLTNSSFRNAILNNAYFINSTCYRVDFTDAIIRFEQLSLCNSLMGATLPDGTKYNGCLNLPGDLEVIDSKTSRNNFSYIASLYGISVDEYIDGQRWFVDHIDKWIDSVNEYYEKYFSGDLSLTDLYS